MNNETTVRLLQAAHAAGRLLLVWGALPLPPAATLDTGTRAQWRALRQRPPAPLPWPPEQWPAAPILTLDPTLDLTGFGASFPLGGDLRAATGLLRTWEDVLALRARPDKAVLLREAAQVCASADNAPGAVLALVPREGVLPQAGVLFGRVWRNAGLHAALGNPPVYGLGPGPWPPEIVPLNAEALELFAALRAAQPSHQGVTPMPESGLERALDMARRNLAFLEEQVAAFGPLHVPPHKRIELQEQQRKVNELEQRMGLPLTVFVAPIAPPAPTPVIPPPPSERYVNFDLHIAPNGHALANSPEGQATATIVLPDAETNANYLPAQATIAEYQQLGRALYALLFPGPLHTHFQQTESAARARGEKIRLRLRIEADTLAHLPLEFAYRDIGGYFLATNPDTVFSRYLNLPMPPGYVRRRAGPLHLLLLIAAPTDQGTLDPAEWEKILRDALAVPIEREQMTLAVVPHATRRAIRDALLQQKPDIVQFVGHGIYRKGKGYLALEQGDGTTWELDDERFASLFAGYDDHLGLISLATCESATSDAPQSFLGIAPKLVQKGIPAVVAMQYSVRVKTAKIFLEDFYTALAARKPVDWAVQQGRNAVALELGFDNREFATPVLYMRAADGEVF